MERTTRASYELVVDDKTGQPLWLHWLASSKPEFQDRFGAPIVKYIAQAGGISDKTLYPYVDGTRKPNLDTLGEIVAAGMDLHGVSEETARRHIVRLVRRPVVRQVEAA